jgi:hypothetical protein
MDRTKFRRTFSLYASVVLIASLAIGAFAAPAAAEPGEQLIAAKQARAEAKAEAKAARDVAKHARADTRAQVKAARQAAKQARAKARAQAKAAGKAAKQGGLEKVAVCHKPGAPAEGTLQISQSALQAHLAHGDVEGDCASPVQVPISTCSETDSSDADGDAVACDEPQEVLVMIDAPDSIGSNESLLLQGGVSGFKDPSYAWSSTCLTDEELTDPSIVASESDTALLVIREDILTPETICEFTLTVTDGVAGTEGSATLTVEVVALS